MPFASELEMFNLMAAKLYSGVISDVLDGLGYRNQCMRADLRPLDPNQAVVGRAHTALSVDVWEIPERPYDTEITFVDSLKPGDVAVFGTNRSTRTGPWGELLSTAAVARGARGAIVDGYIRDVRRIRDLGFPVFCTGMKPVDSMGRGLVIAYDCAVECGDVLVHPGDVIFADVDGVVVIPKAVAEETVNQALEKVVAEDRSRDMLKKGHLLREVYDKFGVL